MLPLRNLFIKDQDLAIAKIIWNFFEAVRLKWPVAWKSSAQGYILNRTNGFRALMRVFRPIYLRLGKLQEMLLISIDTALLFRGMAVSDDDFHIDNSSPGSSGGCFGGAVYK